MAEIGMDPCEKCDEHKESGLKTIQDCDNCETVRLLPDNRYYWSLCAAVTPGLLKDYQVDYSAIKFVFDVYNVSDRETAFEIVLSYAMALLNDRAEAMKGQV